MDIGRDLTDPRLIWAKGSLFFALCGLASARVLISNDAWQEAIFLAIGLWSAARWYYFMFYVIEKYVDPTYRFSGLGSFLRYALTNFRQKDSTYDTEDAV